MFKLNNIYLYISITIWIYGLIWISLCSFAKQITTLKTTCNTDQSTNAAHHNHCCQLHATLNNIAPKAPPSGDRRQPPIPCLFHFFCKMVSAVRFALLPKYPEKWSPSALQSQLPPWKSTQQFLPIRFVPILGDKWGELSSESYLNCCVDTRVDWTDCMVSDRRWWNVVLGGAAVWCSFGRQWIMWCIVFFRI